MIKYTTNTKVLTKAKAFEEVLISNFKRGKLWTREELKLELRHASDSLHDNSWSVIFDHLCAAGTLRPEYTPGYKTPTSFRLVLIDADWDVTTLTTSELIDRQVATTCEIEHRLNKA